MPVYALANYAVTVGSGTNFGSVVVGGVHYAQQFLCDKGTPAQCAAVSAGGAVSTIGVTGSTTAVTQATGTNLHAVIDTGSTTAATQATASNLNAQVVGPGATGAALVGNPVRVALSDGTNTQNWLTALILGDGVNGNNTGAVASWLFNGTTWDRASGTTKGAYGIIRDAAGNARGANVNASSQLSVSCDNGCSASSSITGWGGGTLGAMANYGTSPGAVLVPGVNAFVTNTNANGRATAANSSPVVPVAAASTAGAIVPNNTTAVVVKGSAGTLFGAQIYGIGAAPAYLKIYNAATATCGSGTPVKRLMIPAAATAANGAGSNVTFGPGLAMGTGITYCVTTGIADNDTTAPAAATFLVNVDFE
jgi:hypothetical protein